jgi:hypothetical protein
VCACLTPVGVDHPSLFPLAALLDSACKHVAAYWKSWKEEKYIVLSLEADSARGWKHSATVACDLHMACRPAAKHAQTILRHKDDAIKNE